jgi:hypothetical protein
MSTPSEIWKGLGGRGEIPSQSGRYTGPLLILGGGRTVWDDFAKVRPWKGEIMAVNDAGMHVHEDVKHWVSLHPAYFPGWRSFRTGHCLNLPVCHAQRPAAGVDTAWDVVNVGGTSGLFACYIALMLGYDEIVLGGVPMDNSGHYFDPPWVGTSFVDPAVKQVWREARDRHFKGRVTSLSGVTSQWLGARVAA